MRFGIVGLGNAARMILPSFVSAQDVRLVGAADARPEARRQFSERTHLPAFETLDDLLRLDDLDALWIATPNEFHADHAVAAANAGKHVVCEKPMALTLAECDRMIAAAAANSVKFMLGHSKLRQAPIRKMREVIDSDALGKVIQISTSNFNDWLQRPRLEAEVDTDKGGGICYRQAPHQIDIVRYLARRPARSIRAIANRADTNFHTEGNYTALIEFDGGLAASLCYNAYGYFDISELTWNIGEGGDVRQSDNAQRARSTGPVAASERYDHPAVPSEEKKERR